jgi:hypothetical protein
VFPFSHICLLCTCLSNSELFTLSFTFRRVKICDEFIIITYELISVVVTCLVFMWDSSVSERSIAMFVVVVGKLLMLCSMNLEALPEEVPIWILEMAQIAWDFLYCSTYCARSKIPAYLTLNDDCKQRCSSHSYRK